MRWLQKDDWKGMNRHHGRNSPVVVVVTQPKPNSNKIQEIEIEIQSEDSENEEPPRLAYSNVTKTGWPAELQPLVPADRVIIRQNKELLGVILGCETENRYDILNEQNQVVYVVEETSDFCMRFWCGPLRPIMVNIRQPGGPSIIYLERALACEDLCFPCCLQSLTVASPPHRQIGLIKQKWRFRPELHVTNEGGETEFIIKGPLFQFSCKCGEVDFPIYASDGVSECGRISKRWRGILHDAYTDAYMFGIRFPPGITPWTKVLLIGATFLVDYIYYEETHHG